MTATGEHLLSLLQQLEPFARSSNFSDAALATEKGGTTKLPILQWKIFGKALGFSDQDLSVELDDVISGDSFTFITTTSPESNSNNNNGDDSDEDDNKEEEEEDEAERDILRFCSDWLLAIGGGAVGMFLCEIANVKKFSSRGAAQLAADCAYLGNVLQALDLEPHPFLWWIESVVNQHMDGTGGQLQSKTDAPLKRIKAKSGSISTYTLASAFIEKLHEQLHAALP